MVFLKRLVFCEQPPGFTNKNFPFHVCHLNHALNGLQQASHAWFERLTMFYYFALVLLALKQIPIFLYHIHQVVFMLMISLLQVQTLYKSYSLFHHLAKNFH